MFEIGIEHILVLRLSYGLASARFTDPRGPPRFREYAGAIDKK